MKGKVPKSTLASYKRRAALGELKLETMRELLLENGFKPKAEEEWISPEEQEFYDILIEERSGKLSVKTIKAETPELALVKAAEQEDVSIHKAENVTGAPPRKVAKIVNKIFNL